MTQEIKVARFITGLNYPMNNRMQALRLKTFAEVLEAGKPLEQEIMQQSKRSSNQSQVKDNRRPRPDGDFNQTAPIRRDNGLPPHLKEKAMRERLCFLCLDPSHQRQECPYNGDTRRGMQPREQQNFNRAPNPNGQNFCQGQNVNANQQRVVPQNNAGRNQPNQVNQERPQPRQNAQVQRNGGRPNVHPVPPGVRVNRVQANQEQESIARVYAVVEHQGEINNLQCYRHQPSMKVPSSPYSLILAVLIHSFHRDALGI